MRPSLVEIIDRERKRRKWSMAELDRQAGFSVGESRRFLSGTRQPSSNKVEAILDALRLRIKRS
jgi:transcriptional regulator with XRE-family HTH domain